MSTLNSLQKALMFYHPGRVLAEMTVSTVRTWHIPVGDVTISLPVLVMVDAQPQVSGLPSSLKGRRKEEAGFTGSVLHSIRTFTSDGVRDVFITRHGDVDSYPRQAKAPRFDESYEGDEEGYEDNAGPSGRVCGWSDEPFRSDPRPSAAHTCPIAKGGSETPPTPARRSR